MSNAQQPTVKPAKTCDICQDEIHAGERFHDDGSEIAHAACVCPVVPQ